MLKMQIDKTDLIHKMVKNKSDMIASLSEL